MTPVRASARLCVCAFIAATPLLAQNPTPRDSLKPDTIATAQRPRGDSIRPRPPISPSGAFLRSLVLPGWGQARLDRNVTAGVFVAFEGIAATMYWKASWQLDYAYARDKYVKSHTQERQDWLFLLLFNHLISAAEAYVSAHLYDFPGALKAQVMPDGRAAVGISVPF